MSNSQLELGRHSGLVLDRHSDSELKSKDSKSGSEKSLEGAKNILNKITKTTSVWDSSKEDTLALLKRAPIKTAEEFIAEYMGVWDCPKESEDA